MGQIQICPPRYNNNYHEQQCFERHQSNYLQPPVDLQFTVSLQLVCCKRLSFPLFIYICGGEQKLNKARKTVFPKTRTLILQAYLLFMSINYDCYSKLVLSKTLPYVSNILASDQKSGFPSGKSPLREHLYVSVEKTLDGKLLAFYMENQQLKIAHLDR